VDIKVLKHKFNLFAQTVIVTVVA